MRFSGKRVLVTGGTRGLGKAIGLAFAREGATVVLTHRWGSADEEALRQEFAVAGATRPFILECDVSDSEGTRTLMKQLGSEGGALDIVISNVAFSKVIEKFSDLKKNTLDLSLGYSAWPIVDLAQACQEVFGCFPKYLLGISSDGAESCHAGYDFAGVSKAVLETLCKYLALRLRPHGTRVNAIRFGVLDTSSSRATFGDEVIEGLNLRAPGFLIDVDAAAQVCLALCSGWMDSVTGQILNADEGWGRASPIALLSGKGIPEDFSDVR